MFVHNWGNCYCAEANYCTVILLPLFLKSDELFSKYLKMYVESLEVLSL